MRILHWFGPYIYVVTCSLACRLRAIMGIIVMIFKESIVPHFSMAVHLLVLCTLCEFLCYVWIV